MPRDGSGVYTLPAGNPVVDGTIIETSWANPTMSDIAVQLNNVLTRDGLLGPAAPVKFTDGTVAQPSIAFATEPGLGLFRPAANTLAWAMLGTERMRLTSDGSLKIGSGANAGYIKWDTGSSEFRVGTDGAFPIKLYPNGTAKATLDTAGNLGLGVTPSAWGSGQGVVQLQSGALWAYNSSNLSVAVNVYQDGSNERYVLNGYASQFWQNAGSFNWKTYPSGTAGAVATGTTLMTLTKEGSLGIGTSPASDCLLTVGASAATTAQFICAQGANSKIVVGQPSSGLSLFGQTAGTYSLIAQDTTPAKGLVIGNLANNLLVFGTNNTERMRIANSGQVGIGTTVLTAPTCRLNIGFPGGGSEYGLCFKPAADGTNAVFFTNAAASNVGSIYTTSSGTSYNTSSDRRLKENIIDSESATAKVQSLQVRQFNFKTEPDKTVKYGFIAQELNEVEPSAVTRGDDGEEVDRAWGVDYSKVVPMLTKALQEIIKRVEALESA